MRNAWGVAVGLSLLLHLGLYGWMRWSLRMPELGFELQLPAEVELGITHDAPESGPASSADAPLTPDAPPPPPEAPPPTTAVPRPAQAKPGGPNPSAREALARPPEAREAATQHLARQAPAGTQLALRLDLAHLRGSTLAADIRSVLESSEDWQRLLRGSGVDPLADLDRLFVASSDLRRANLIVAGQHRREASYTPNAVTGMAAARDRVAAWSDHAGMPIADWHDDEPIERVIALVDASHFIIAPPDLLPNVLSVARAVLHRGRYTNKRSRDTGPLESPATEGLLALSAGEHAVLEVEGARAFAHGRTQGVPTRLRIAFHEVGSPGSVAHAIGHFDTPEQAQAAARFWRRVCDTYARHPLVALMGLATPLKRLDINAQDATVVARAPAGTRELRLALGFIRSALSGSRSGTVVPGGRSGNLPPSAPKDTP